MKNNNNLRTILFIFGIVAFIMALAFFMLGIDQYSGSYGSTFDFPYDGGVAGFAILSGLSFLSMSLIRREKKLEVKIDKLKFSIYEYLMVIKDIEEEEIEITAKTQDKNILEKRLDLIHRKLTYYEKIVTNLKKRLSVVIKEIPETESIVS